MQKRVKGLIVYKSKYGATHQYANWLGEQLGFPVTEAGDADARTLHKYDVIVMGSSVYVGKILIGRWMKEYEDILKDKELFLFVVCGTPPAETGHLAAMLNTNMSQSLRQKVELFFLHGRMILTKLGWFDRFLLKMGARLEKDKATSKRMLEEFDDVKREHLIPLVESIKEKTSHHELIA